MKIKLNLSLDEDTAERLKRYAAEQHTTASGAVTQWIWGVKMSGGDPRGQQTIIGKIRAAKRKEGET